MRGHDFHKCRRMDPFESLRSETPMRGRAMMRTKLALACVVAADCAGGASQRAQV